MVWLGDCYYIIIVDNECEIVINEIVMFIKCSIEIYGNEMNCKYFVYVLLLKDRWY